MSLIAIASFVMAPIFQNQLNEQFLLGARNQVFVTEHIVGFETVKTFQMEPPLRVRYSGYLATTNAQWRRQIFKASSHTRVDAPRYHRSD